MALLPGSAGHPLGGLTGGMRRRRLLAAFFAAASCGTVTEAALRRSSNGAASSSASAAFLSATSGGAQRLSAATAERALATADSAGGQAAGDAQQSCSCDCCVSQLVSRAASGGGGEGPPAKDGHETEPTESGGESELVCVPRAQGFNPEEGPSECPNICQVDESHSADYDALSTEVDYTRFCLGECSTAGGAPGGQVGDAPPENLLCAPKSALKGGGQDEEAQEVVSDGESAVQGGTVPTTMAPPTVTPFKITSAMLAMAKSKMEEAKRHAEAAGRSARAARMAYETATASSIAMGEAAGQATYKKIEEAASEQAWEAFEIRQKYIKDTQTKALKAAQDAAMVYQKAKMRDLARAGVWGQRATEYKAASVERSHAAEDEALQAMQYKAIHDFDYARDLSARAEAAEDQSDEYLRRSEAASKQAEVISENSKEYDVAMLAAAKYALARSLPPDVAAPPLPLYR